jgi:hypothetical protein
MDTPGPLYYVTCQSSIFNTFTLELSAQTGQISAIRHNEDDDDHSGDDYDDDDDDDDDGGGGGGGGGGVYDVKHYSA